MKITKRQLKRIIREEKQNLLRESNEQRLQDLADELELERSDALLGAAMELEAREPELQYVGRCPHSGVDVYQRYDNTYTTEDANGERLDGLSDDELIDVLDGRY